MSEKSLAQQQIAADIDEVRHALSDAIAALEAVKRNIQHLNDKAAFLDGRIRGFRETLSELENSV